MAMSLSGSQCTILTAVYNDWQSVCHLLPVLDKELIAIGMTGSVVIVDDASTDEDGEKALETIAFNAISSVEVVKLASNQGNQRALAVGVGYIAQHQTCDYLIVMDSDFEDRPEDVPTLLQACREGQDQHIVFAERTHRSESIAFRIFYFLYRRLSSILTGSTISVGNFSVVPAKFIRRLAHIAELWNHFPASIKRAGIPHTQIPNRRGTRVFGKGKMNFVKLIVHAFSNFAIYADVVAVRLLIFALLVGLGFVLLVITSIIIYFSTEILLPGWTSQFLFEALNLFAIVLGTATSVLFIVLSLRMQSRMIPFYDHMRFIFDVIKIRTSPLVRHAE